MKILLTGATGFLGSAILRRLTLEKADVKVLIRENSNRSNLKGQKVDICIGDLLDIKSLERAIRGCNILIHTAADYRIWAPNPAEIIESNVQGTKNIMAVAGSAGVGKIIYTSSVAALGSSSPPGGTTEDTPSSIEEKIGAYKKSKYLAEIDVLNMHKKDGLPVIIVNPSAPIGPRDIKPTPTGQLVLRAASGKIPVYVDSGLNVVHVDDVADGHLLAIQRGKEGEKYILGGENLTLLQILTIIADITGQKPPILKIPHELALSIAYISELWARYFSHTEPFATIDSVKMSEKPMFYNSHKAITELGYKTRPIKQAFVESINWYKKYGYIK